MSFLLPWQLALFLLALSACSTSRVVDAGADVFDDTLVDAAEDAALDCVAGEITTQWIRDWGLHVNVASVPGFGLFATGSDEGEVTVERIDATGARMVFSRLRDVSGWVRFIADTDLRAAFTSTEGLEVRTIFNLYPVEWRVDSPNVLAISATASGGVAVLSDHTSQPLSYETYSGSGSVVSARTPVAIDGYGRLHPRIGRDPMISVRSHVEGEDFVAIAGGEFQAIEASCDAPSTALLPLEGEALLWAEACHDDSLTLSVWSAGSLLAQRSLSGPSERVELSHGPEGTVFLAASGSGRTALLLLDEATLEEVARGELLNDTSEIAYFSVTAVTAVQSGVAALAVLGHDADVPVGRLALAHVCPLD